MNKERYWPTHCLACNKEGATKHPDEESGKEIYVCNEKCFIKYKKQEQKIIKHLTKERERLAKLGIFSDNPVELQDTTFKQDGDYMFPVLDSEIKCDKCGVLIGYEIGCGDMNCLDIRCPACHDLSTQ